MKKSRLLYEDLTMGIGCAGSRPLVALSDQWPDLSGLRLAHELGHALGILEHVPGTVMGDASDRTDQLPLELCVLARSGALRLLE